MLTLIYFVIVLGLLVCIHEFGHFAAAKLCNVYVDRFSIGMGSPVVKWQGKETVYCLAWIPLGGYVQMAGQCDLPDEEQKELYKDVDPARFYTSKNVWQRLFIILAGPCMNLVFALPLAFALLCYGQQTSIIPDGITVSMVIPESPAEKAGLRPGDRIQKLNGHDIATWESFVEEVRGSLYQPVTLSLERDGSPIETQAVPEFNEAKKYLGLGLAMAPLAQVRTVEADIPGLRPGDVFLGIQGLPAADCTFETLSETIRRHPGTNLTAVVAAYLPSRLADEKPAPEKRTIAIPVGCKPKCPDFELLESEGQLRLLPRPGAPENLEEFAGARVLAVNGKPLSTAGFKLEELPLGEFSLSVAQALQKEGRLSRETAVTTLVSRVELLGHAGIGLMPAAEKVRAPFLKALAGSPAKAWSKFDETLKTLKLLFTGTLKVSNLSGPVGIARMTGAAAERGFDVLLNFVLLITVNLGILNLLPLPVLDGGHVVLLLAEGIRRKPLPESFQLWYQRAGLLLLLALFVLVMWNDIARWIGDSEFLGTLLGKFFR